MITKAQATRMLDEFEQEIARIGYETSDKRALTNIFGYLRVRLSDCSIYPNTSKLRALDALELRWHQDRNGKLVDHGGLLAYDPAGTQKGAATIHGIIKELRAFVAELPVKLDTPAPIVLPAMLAPFLAASTVTNLVDEAIAKALAARDAQRELASA